MKPAILILLFFIFSTLISSLSQRSYLLFWYLISFTAHTLDVIYIFNNQEIKKSNKNFIQWLISDIEYSFPRWWKCFYEQYSMYDIRYILSDPLIISIGVLEIVEAILSLLIIILFQTETAYYLQTILASFQIFGTLLYFIVPYIGENSKYIYTKNLFEYILFIIILNSLWIVIPAVLLIDSFYHLANITKYCSV